MKADTCTDILCWTIERWNDDNEKEKLTPELIDLIEVSIRKAYERSWLELKSELKKQVNKSIENNCRTNKYWVPVSTLDVILGKL